MKTKKSLDDWSMEMSGEEYHAAITDAWRMAHQMTNGYADGRWEAAYVAAMQGKIYAYALEHS